jgi:hypothetical protein
VGFRVALDPARSAHAPTLRGVDTSLVVSIVAVLIAGGSLALALRADRRATRAESRAGRAQIAIEPVRAHVEAAGRRFELRIRNVGAGVARTVRVWLENEAGRAVSSVAGGEDLTLAPGDETILSVTVSEAALPPPPVTFPVLVSWDDPAGSHDRQHTGASAST